ncbi:MAG: diphosphatase [Thermoleophilaceae bacterium]|jgi:NAD+ diphosphatase|nr:diphosphatase [Thermoleophilaceae bacterium]
MATERTTEAPLTFSGAALDRAPVERGDAAWLARQRAHPQARSLVLSERGLWLDGERLLLVPPGPDSVFLGLSGERALFATDATEGEPQSGHPAGLREAATGLPAEEAALAAYAASLVSWHRRHRFCASCGAPTESADGGHERRCTACDAHHFPRTDPVVIVRVTDGADRLLLGRQPSWPTGRFSVLAGFVEPGETLEEAVRREVLEESGVMVESAAYVASQPWPFPSSLMIGFNAVGTGGDPRPGDGELSEVRWFARAEVEAAAAEQGEILLPPAYSISRRLIDAWLEASGPAG